MTEWAPDRGVTASPFPPIAEYAFLSDCETCALVAPNGNVEWLCLPRFDSPSVFGAILDRDAGGFRLGPADVEVPAARRYLPGTKVLETSWGTSGGWIIVRDVLLIGPWHHEHDRSHTHRRAPDRLRRRPRAAAADPLRERRGAGDAGLRAALRLRPQDRASGSTRGVGLPRGGLPRRGHRTCELRLTTDMNMGFEGPRATARTLMKEGDTLFVALSWSEHPPPKTYEEAYDRLVWTAHHWQHWLDHGTFPDHPWRTHLQRSALTLKGLSYAPTGALVAAATTSLPETPGGERNWDYRYTWIRDATFMLWGLYTLGFDWEANDFFYFIADVAEAEEDHAPDHVRDRRRGRARREHARPPVRLRGRAAGPDRQRRLRPGAARRLGRAARLDLPAHEVARPPARADLADPQASRSRTALENWREPDRGIWEIRGEPQALHLVQADVLGGRATAARGWPRSASELEYAARWQSAADEIKADILRERASTSAACSASTTTRTRSTPRCC